MIYIYYRFVAACSVFITVSYTDRHNQSAPGVTMQKASTANQAMAASLTGVSFHPSWTDFFRKPRVAMLGIM
jgi:hypothetical protein